MESSKPSETFLLTHNNCLAGEVTSLLQAAVPRVVTYFLRNKSTSLESSCHKRLGELFQTRSRRSYLEKRRIQVMTFKVEQIYHFTLHKNIIILFYIKERKITLFCIADHRKEKIFDRLKRLQSIESNITIEYVLVTIKYLKYQDQCQFYYI